MASERNYTKREHDEFRRENRDQFERIMRELSKIQDRMDADSKSIDGLKSVVAGNGDQISALWKRIDENRSAVEMIEDIIKFSKVTKWFVYLVIGAGSLYGAIRILLLTIIRL